MKKIIRLTESDLIRLVKRIIKEGVDETFVQSLMSRGFKKNEDKRYYNPDSVDYEYIKGKNSIRITIYFNDSNKHYKVLSVLSNPNYTPKPNSELDTFDSTKIDLNKYYSKGQENTIIQYIDNFINKIKSKV